jgi:putative Holliday junction resolvase
MKCLGMDLGTKTLGLATSDKLGLISSPYKTIRYNDINELVDEVVNLIAELKIEVLVLGYPKNMNNTLGEAVERTENFKNLLSQKTNLEINLIDERLSTVEAENILLSGDVSRMGRKKVIDAVAASIILDTYLRRMERR